MHKKHGYEHAYVWLETNESRWKLKSFEKKLCTNDIYFIKDFCSYFQKLVYGLKDFRK